MKLTRGPHFFIRGSRFMEQFEKSDLTLSVSQSIGIKWYIRRLDKDRRREFARDHP